MLVTLLNAPSGPTDFAASRSHGMASATGASARVVSADPASTRVEEIGLGSHERPFISSDLILSGAAFVDLHALRGNDHRQRFAREGLELVRHLDHGGRLLRTRAGDDQER